MPTATTTLSTATTTTAVTPFKQTQSLSLSSSAQLPCSSKTTSTTLRSLYNRATRAFLHRDVSLTDSLLSSAFTLLQPPTLLPDTLTAQRRKWDILRITVETTIYASPPKSHQALPQSLHANILEPPFALIISLYNRSLNFFTPTSALSTKPNAAFLPSQVLITLVYSSLKLGCPEAGRVIIEDWLAQRGSPDSLTLSDSEDGDAYEKILELYCLQVLPKLEQWDYANEFLGYESELAHETRTRLKSSLSMLHTQTLSSRIRTPPSDFLSTPQYLQNSSSSRPYSPAPSSSSTGSSISTTSNRTAVPSTPRPMHVSQPQSHTLSSLTSRTPASLSTASLSSSSSSTATPTPNSPPTDYRLKSRSTSRSHPNRGTANHTPSLAPLSLPRSNPQEAALRPSSPSTWALLKASIEPYLTTPNLTTIILLFVVFPLVSFVLRLRRRRALASGAATPSVGGSVVSNNRNAELVRRRLQAVSGREHGVLGRVWGEVVRAVVDAVRMGASGLV